MMTTTEYEEALHFCENNTPEIIARQMAVDVRKIKGAEARAERAEAENARLRSALQRIAHGNVLNRECPGIALNALATPSDEQPTPEQSQDELVREAQERGEYGDDALAALEMLHELAEAAWRGGMRSDCVNNLAGVLRLHLTASAVPEQVRRLPDGWRKVAAATRITSLSDVAEEASADIYDQCADALERAIASAPAVPDGWQPIETAPKDGTFVLVYEGSTTRRMWRAQWDESIGWMFGATSDDHIACAFFRVAPTHWMPLPAEPQHGGE